MKKINRNLLGKAQNYYLSDWLVKAKDRILHDRTPRSTLAKEAEKELQFKITEGNVRGCTDALGIKYYARGKGSTLTSNKAMVLAQAIVGIADELSLELPEEVAEMAEGDRPDPESNEEEDEEE